MIWESGPWKHEIAKRAAALELRKNQKRWVTASGPKFEMDIFYSAYAVRKLIEAYKVSDEVEALTMPAYRHAPLERAADIMNWDRLDELYDMTIGEEVTLSLLDYCNQLIHSFILLPCFHEPGAYLMGIFVASDRQKSDGLYYIEIDVITDMLMRVAQDDIVSLDMRRASVGEPMQIVKKSSKPRDES